MFTIGKLASLTSVSNDTLRYYEQEGLVEPAGKVLLVIGCTTRISARRIRFIKHAQNCGFTLAEIRDLLCLAGTRQGLLRRRPPPSRRENCRSKVNSLR